MKSMDQIRAEAWSTTLDCTTRHDVPADAPADLADKQGWLDFTSDGHLVVSRLLPEDVVQGLDQPYLDYDAHRIVSYATPALALSLFVPVIGPALAGLGVIGLGVHTYRRGGGRHAVSAVVGAVNSLLSAGLMLPLITYVQSGACGRHSMLLRKRRGAVLIEQNANFSSMSLFARQHAINAELRRVQSENAKRDTSSFIKLGVATGSFVRNLDPLGADQGLPFGLTSEGDLKTHLFGFGRTGAGKTSGLARPVIRQWVNQNCGGLVVLDGKGHLPVEMANTPDYQLIQPGRTTLPLLYGLRAEDVVAVLVDNGDKPGGDDGGFWRSTGETMLLQAAVMLEAAPDKNRFPWTVVSLQKVINDKEYRRDLIEHIGQTCADTVNTMGPLYLAAAYWLDEYPAMDTKTLSNVAATVNSWLGPLTGHRDLIPWAAAATGFDVASVLTGARIGLNCPSFIYGRAGNIVAGFVKAQIYQAIKRRSGDWARDPSQRPVLMAMDECHLLLDRNDADSVTTGRSLGLRVMGLTQSIDEMIARLGEHATDAFMNNFRNIVSFSSSKRTLAYVCDRAENHLRALSSLHDADKQAIGIDYKSVERSTVYGPANNTSLNKEFDNVLFGLGDVVRDSVTAVRSLVGWDEKSMMRGYSGTVGRMLAPTCTPQEAAMHLALPFHALAVIERSGVPRRDVIKVEPMFS